MAGLMDRTLPVLFHDDDLGRCAHRYHGECEHNRRWQLLQNKVITRFPGIQQKEIYVHLSTNAMNGVFMIYERSCINKLCSTQGEAAYPGRLLVMTSGTCWTSMSRAQTSGVIKTRLSLSTLLKFYPELQNDVLCHSWSSARLHLSLFAPVLHAYRITEKLAARIFSVNQFT